MRGTSAAILAALLVAGTAASAYAQLAISANDAKLRLVDGKVEVQKSPPPDTVTIIDLRTTPPKVLAQLDVPRQRGWSADRMLRCRRRRTSRSFPPT